MANIAGSQSGYLLHLRSNKDGSTVCTIEYEGNAYLTCIYVITVLVKY